MAQGDPTRPDPGDGDLSAAPGAAADSLEAVLQEAVAAPAAYPVLEAGTVVAKHYVLDRVLGAGGMGTVYLARDTRLDRDVALKLHHSTTDASRLHREAIAMAKLAHPNVVTVFEVGDVDGRPFVAMEYIRGTTLRAWLAERERSHHEILATLLDAGEGLAAAHDANLVHRDVKPDNIFVGADGRVRVGDFGLAQVSRASSGPVFARLDTNEQTGTVVGTPAYMAPEQIEGRELDARTDQFALCVAAWEALAGERPFAGATTGELREAIARGELRPGRRRVPARLRRVLARGMAPDPRDRWPSVRALLARLRAAERRPRVIAAAIAGAVVIGGVIGLLAWPAVDPATSCATAGAEIDQVLPDSLADAAAAVVRSAGRANGPDEISRITRAARARRDEYRTLAGMVCRAEVRGQWTEELAAAARECMTYVAQTSRELFVAAPLASAQSSDVVQIATQLPVLAPCADPKLLAGWTWLSTDPAKLERIIAARARLDAGVILVSLGQLGPARAIRDAVAADPIHTEPAVALRLDLLRGSIALDERRVEVAEPLLADVYLRSRAQNDGVLAVEAARQLIELTGRARRDAAGAQKWVREGMIEAERVRAIAPRAVRELHLAAASALELLGDPKAALELLDREHPGEPDEALAVSTAVIRANVLTNLGRVPEALASMAGAIDAARTLLGPRHPRVADLYATHAAILIEARKEQEALAAAMEAKAILDGTGADRSTAVANAELNLGAALIEAELPGAGEHLEKARAIWVDSYGEIHPDVALIDSNLAILYMDRKEPEKAVAMLRNAARIQRELLGPEHEELAASLYNLACAERDAGRLDEALASARRCAEIYERRQPQAMRHATSLALLASLYNRRKAYAEALAAATRSMEAPSSTTPESQIYGWSRLEAARALIGLRRDGPRARTLLAEARARYAGLNIQKRVDEIDAVLATLR